MPKPRCITAYHSLPTAPVLLFAVRPRAEHALKVYNC